MKTGVFIAGLCALLASCVSDFTPEVKGVSGILVVDGAITNGESLFTLSRSVCITDTLWGDEGITNAVLAIERSDGTILPAENEGKGTYRVQTGDLDPEMAYRLSFTIGDKAYQSSFLKPMQRVEIDSLSYAKADLHQPVTIHVSTHDDSNRSPYYRWSFVENWELKAKFFASHGYWEGQFIPFTPYKNAYYCWAKDVSKTLLIASTERLKENRIVNETLTEIPCDNEKVSILYHIEVTQMQLREEAYDYFRILRDEIERTGGLFSPVMSADDNGNILCLNDPEETIIGFIEVANTSKKSMFVPCEELFEDTWQCRTGGTMSREERLYHWIKFSYSGGELNTYSSEECVDCRTHYHATKNKPSWWPTDHY